MAYFRSGTRVALMLATSAWLCSSAAAAAPALTAPVHFDTMPRAGQQQRQQMKVQASIQMRMEASPQASDEQRARAAQVAQQIAATNPMKMDMGMQQTIKVGQPDTQGWLPMSFDLDVQRMNMDMGGTAIPLPKEKRPILNFDARFNPKNFALEIVGVNGQSEVSQALRARGTSLMDEQLNLFRALALKPLRPGESVEVPLSMSLPLPVPGVGDFQGKAIYTLRAVKQGVAHFDVTTDMAINADMAVPPPGASPASAASSAPETSGAQADPAASAPAAMTAASAPAAMPNLHMHMEGRGAGTTRLRLADRLVTASQMNMDIQMTMGQPEASTMRMDVKMTMESKGESLSSSSPGRGVKASGKAAPKTVNKAGAKVSASTATAVPDLAQGS